MVGSLVQSAVVPALHGSRAQWRRSTKTHALARVSMSKLQVHSCPLRSSGSRIPHTTFLGAGSILPGQTARPVCKQARSVAVKVIFERFTAEASKVVMLAQEEARRLGHNFVGTEQILLGLIGEGTGIAAKVLKSMGINLKDARVEVEKFVGRGGGLVSVEIPFNPRAKRVLELSSQEALQLGHDYIGSEHLLLGLLQEGEGVAACVLETLGVDPSDILAQVRKMVWESTEAVGTTFGEFGTNLTKLTEEGKLDPVVGRQEQRARIMGRRTKNNPCLIGEPGVGKTLFEQFTEEAIKVTTLAHDEARRLGHNFVGTEQILLALIGEGTGIAAKALKSVGINLKDARVEVEKVIGRGSGIVAVEIPFTPRVKRVLELSLDEARQLGHNCIGSEHLLLGLLREGEGVAARVLETLGADPSNIRIQVIRMVWESTEAVGADVGGGSSGQKIPSLEEYGTNLTKLAEEGKLDPVVGRQEQIERVARILGKRTRINPCLIGEPGVGKTAIVEGLAQRIANGDVPETIKGKKVITLDMGLLVAGTKYRGELEERLKKLMKEIKQSDDIILFIDEVHTLIEAGAAEDAIDAANILKSALARGELQCIGATTPDEYRKHIEKDPALERKFQPVKVPEPTVYETIQILNGLRGRYEIHHKVRYTEEALVAAVQLSYQYISDRFLPDKAIDLIDEAGSRVRLRFAQLREEARGLDEELCQITKEKTEAVRGQDFEKARELRDREMDLRNKIKALINKGKEEREIESESGESGPVVTEADIQHVVSSWTGIPVEVVSYDESNCLLKMEKTFHNRIFGQDEAVKAISRAICHSRFGLKNPNRPIASFIFSGPTGIDKSELAKVLATYYFGSEEAMIRLDMSEFMEQHTVSKLIGSPPGYVGYTEGGQLTEAVRCRPYSVVLFDEIEKAHPDVFNMILQILEGGMLTDSMGRTVDFKNTLLILTSNVGSSVIEKGGPDIGFDQESDKKDSSYNRIKSFVAEELKQYFQPEFLNMLDELIVFRQLTKLEVKEIVDVMLKKVFDGLKKIDIDLQVTVRFRDWVVDEGYNSRYGAGPLRRAIMRLLVDKLGEKMLAGEVNEGDSAIVDVNSEGKAVVLTGDSDGAAKRGRIREKIWRGLI